MSYKQGKWPEAEVHHHNYTAENQHLLGLQRNTHVHSNNTFSNLLLLAFVQASGTVLVLVRIFVLPLSLANLFVRLEG
jgi:hypothetical protein